MKQYGLSPERAAVIPRYSMKAREHISKNELCAIPINSGRCLIPDGGCSVSDGLFCGFIGLARAHVQIRDIRINRSGKPQTGSKRKIG